MFCVITAYRDFRETLDRAEVHKMTKKHCPKMPL